MIGSWHFSDTHPHLTKTYESHLLAGVFERFWLEMAVSAGVFRNSNLETHD